MAAGKAVDVQRDLVPVAVIRPRSMGLVYDFGSILGSFGYQIAQIPWCEQIPLGDKHQRLVAIGDFVLHAVSLDAACAQKVVTDAVAGLEQREEIPCPAPKGGIVIRFQADQQIFLFQLVVGNRRKRIEQFFQSAGKVDMPDAVHHSLGQGSHRNGIPVRVLADDYVVSELEGMILIGDPVNDKRAESLVCMQIDGVELLGLECIVLERAVVGDASAAYPGTPGGILIFYGFRHPHDAKVQRKIYKIKLTD